MTRSRRSLSAPLLVLLSSLTPALAQQGQDAPTASELALGSAAHPAGTIIAASTRPEAARTDDAKALAAARFSPAVSRAAVVDLDEVVISALRTASSRLKTGVAISALSTEDLRADSRAALAEVLAQQPGVSLMQNGPYGNAGNLLIRGVGAGHVAVLVDGIRVDDPSTIQGGLDIGSFLSSDVGRVEILRGSQSALWGSSAVGGVVSISSRRPQEEGLHQSLEIEAGSNATTRLTYGLEHKQDRMELAFTASHYLTDGFSSARLGREKDGAETHRLSLWTRYQLTEALAVGGNLFTQRTEQQYDDAYLPWPDSRLIDSFATQQRRETGARVFAEYEAGSTSHLFELTGYQIDRDFDDSWGTEPYQGKRLTLGWQAVTEVSDQITLVYGLDWMEERASYPSLPGKEASRRVAGAFAQGIWSPSERLDLSLALRLDRDEGFGNYTTGRLAAAYHLTEDTTLRAAVAKGYRAPSLDQRFANYIYPGFASYYGNPDLMPEESLSYEIGLEHGFANGATLSASLFHLELDNFIRSLPIDPADPFGDQRNVNVAGVTEFRGMELAAHLPLGDAARLGFGYTYTEAENRPGVARERLTASLDGTIWGALSGGIRLTRVEGLQGVKRDLPDYTVVDAQFGYQLPAETEVYLRVENLTDANYEAVDDYGVAGRSVYVGLRKRF